MEKLKVIKNSTFKDNRGFYWNTWKKGLLKKLIKKHKIKYPIVVKRTNEGSSIGVYICKNETQFRKNHLKENVHNVKINIVYKLLKLFIIITAKDA